MPNGFTPEEQQLFNVGTTIASNIQKQKQQLIKKQLNKVKQLKSRAAQDIEMTLKVLENPNIAGPVKTRLYNTLDTNMAILNAQPGQQIGEIRQIFGTLDQWKPGLDKIIKNTTQVLQDPSIPQNIKAQQVQAAFSEAAGLQITKELQENLQPLISQTFGEGVPQEFTVGGRAAVGRVTPLGQVAELASEQPGVSQETIQLTQPQFERATKLREEFTKASGEFIKIRDSFQRVQQAAKDPSAAGDLALIFNYMKTLDPGSVVRESEFATAQNAGGVPDRIRATYNKVLSGKRLSANQRKDFVDRAERLFEPQQKQHKQREIEYTRLAEQQNINSSLVIPDLNIKESKVQEFKSIEEAEQANLPKGTIIMIGGRKAIVE